MYVLYTDKSEEFKCHIDVEGTALSSTKARVVLENKDLNLMFEGSIDTSGNCVIPIKKLKNLLPEGSEGNMKLEVIADDTYFSPWEDSFSVKVNKKVTVEVFNDTRKEQIKENRVKVQVKPQERIVEKKQKVTPRKNKTHAEALSTLLESKGVTLDNFEKHIDKILPLVETYKKKYKVKDSAEDLLNEVIINL
jgi:hypothetical protein